MSYTTQHEPIKKFAFGYRVGDTYTPLVQEKEDLVRVFTAERVVVPAKEDDIVRVNEKARRHNMK